jgi:hydroxyethylthiazole kinase
MKTDIQNLFQVVQDRNPLVHHITNTVTINDCANVTLAIGGSPVMASSVDEAADMVKLANSLVINFGTLDSTSFEAMLLAGKMANQMGVPVIFDPVGVGATPYRTKMAEQLVSEIQISIIRGNASEINNLIGGQANTRGVDSGDIGVESRKVAETAAQLYKNVLVVSGVEDVISDGKRTFFCQNGDPYLTKITGSGCMATALIGTFAGASEDMLAAAVAGISTMSVAGELTVKSMATPIGTGTFRMKLMDCISTMTGDLWEKEVKLID